MTGMRSDDNRVLSGAPVDAERGSTPGAVQLLRAKLRETAKELVAANDAIGIAERRRAALEAERDIRRESCDELMDAIEALGGETR